jgi:putative Mg2+ transporter-C (MgtC) family protein
MPFFDPPDVEQLLRVLARLLCAALLGAVLGYERERKRRAAGLRTHVLVALGAALFTLASLETGTSIADLSRVTQGVVTGIGFVGAGAILKLNAEREVQGLTTAASVWLTAALGAAAGMGQLWLALLTTCLATVTLILLHGVDPDAGSSQEAPK